MSPGARMLLLLCSCLAAGCQSAKVAEPLTAKLAGNEPEAQLEFWHTLAQRSLTSNDEAFHGLLLFLDGADPATDYAGRVRALRARNLLPKNFDQPADQAVQRGVLATAIVRALDIRGGLMQRLTNDHPRYAVRELMYMDLYPPSSPQQTFSGTEYLGIIGRVEDYQRGNPADYPAAVMPGEADGEGTEIAPPNPGEAKPPPVNRAAPTVQPTR